MSGPIHTEHDMRIYHTVFFFRVLTYWIIRPRLLRGWMKISDYLQPP